jgi:molecular chaperone GrpE
MAEVEGGQTEFEDEGSFNEDSPAGQGEALETVELRKKCEELEQTVAQLKDQLLRKAAEFDNYKKRTEAEALTVIRFANEDLLLRILPVVDDLERSFKALGPGRETAGAGAPADAEPVRRETAFIAGVELIFGKLRKALEQAGLKPFESVGKPFDPELHDALLQVPREDVPHHTVVEEIDRGYQINDRVIRHARVIVSSQPAQPGPAAS